MHVYITYLYTVCVCMSKYTYTCNLSHRPDSWSIVSPSYLHLPCSNQTWRAGKWTIYQWFSSSNLHLQGIFQLATFDSQRVNPMKTPVNHHFPMVFPWFTHGIPMVLPVPVGISPLNPAFLWCFGLLSPGAGPWLSAAFDPSRRWEDKGGNDDTPRNATHGLSHGTDRRLKGELRYGKNCLETPLWETKVDAWLSSWKWSSTLNNQRVYLQLICVQIFSGWLWWMGETKHLVPSKLDNS